jgi:hypothetical protein
MRLLPMVPQSRVVFCPVKRVLKMPSWLMSAL